MRRVVRAGVAAALAVAVIVPTDAVSHATVPLPPPPTVTVEPPDLLDVGSGTTTVPSCAADDFCAVADQSGYVTMWDGVHWGRPELVDRSDPAAQPRLQVECPTTSLCVAVDAAAHAFVWRGGSWSGPVNIDNPIDSAGASIESLSCATATFCVAMDQDARSITFDGSAWSTPVPTGFEPDPISVSCPSEDFCLAVLHDDYTEFDGVGWSAVAPIADPATEGSWNHVSCADPTFCYAVSYSGHAARFDGTAWHLAADPAPGEALFDVQCPQDRFCAVTGSPTAGFDSYLTRLGPHGWDEPVTLNVRGSDYARVRCRSADFCISGLGHGPLPLDRPQTSVLTAEGWQAPDHFPTVAGGDLVAISCVASGYCLAIDGAGFALRHLDNGWSSPRAVPDAVAEPTAVSCVSSRFCAVLDRFDGALQWNDGRWSQRTEVGTDVKAVQCVTVRFCVAVGGDSVVTFDGSVWSAPKVIDPNGDLESLSCPSVSFCIAVDGHRNALRYDGTTWTAPHRVGAGLLSVSCASPTFCAAGTALNGYPAVTFFDGQLWHHVRIVSDDRYDGAPAVQCPSTSGCVGVTSESRIFTVSPGGVTGEQLDAPAAIAPLRITGLSCPTSSLCRASYPDGVIDLALQHS